MSRARTEAFKNLKLDGGFFQRILRRELVNLPQEAEQDFDLYLMEKAVMPVLLQGLDALSRHVDKMNTKAELCGGPSGGARPAFNPLTWLAQYLLRNHPGHVKDHRTPMYQHFGELADVERGRRGLLRRRGEFEELWYEMERAKELDAIGLEHIPEVVQRLDVKWHLDGTFAKQMPEDYSRVLDAEKSAKGVLFVDFWSWFESFVWQHDLLRASAFEEAQERLRQAELEAQRAREEALQRERAKNEAIQKRKAMEEQFEAVSADMYINAEVNKIMNKGFFLDVEEQEGSVPSKGEHISLIISMLRLWGFPVVHYSSSDGGSGTAEAEDDIQGSAAHAGEAQPEDAPAAKEEAAPQEAEAAENVREASPASANGLVHHNTWDLAAQEAWEGWSTMHGPGTLQVDSAGVRAIMDMQAFEEYLVRAFPLRSGSGEAEAPHLVEVHALVDDGAGSLLIEAIDVETGKVLHVAAPEAQVEEIRLRLEEYDSSRGPTSQVMARVDTVTNRIMEVVPAGEHRS